MPKPICLMPTSESAIAVEDISFEAQIIKDVLNEVIDNVKPLKLRDLESWDSA